jgi:hypothetical protein
MANPNNGIFFYSEKECSSDTHGHRRDLERITLTES